MFMLKKIFFFMSLNIVFILANQCYAQGVDNKNEAKGLVQQLSSYWTSYEYQQAKDLIDTKLLEKPGWIPAILLKSGYYRHIEVDPNASLSILSTIDDVISALDSVQYKDFIAFYNLYKYGIENDPQNFTEQQKVARRELAHELFTYFPGSELVSIYFSCIPAEESNNWYDPNWDYRKKITIQNTYVDSNLADFPLYVKIDSDPNLGAHTQADGDDIRFTLADGVTVLSYEKESFSITSGNATGNFWVKVPFIDSSSVTDIYLYYGNSEASNWLNPASVWSNGLAGVWHMNQTSGDVIDSTSSGNDLSNYGAAQGTDGKIHYAYTFDDTESDYLQIDTSSISVMPLTLYCWAKTDSVTANDYQMAVWIGDKDETNRYWGIAVNWSGSGSVRAYTNSRLDAMAESSTTISAGSWNQLVAVFNGTSDRSIYVNGGSKGTNSTTVTDLPSPDRTAVGRAGDSTPAWYFDGSIDEVRIYNRALSDAEVKFSYYNQNESDNELTWAAEETM